MIHRESQVTFTESEREQRRVLLYEDAIPDSHCVLH